jgi:hypothetical protein
MRPDSSNRPAAARYWLARFKTFAKPQVWAGGLALIGLLAFAWELSQRPNWQQALTQGPADNMTPEEKEDQAIGADLDSLPLLSADLNPKKQNQSQQQSPNPADPLAQLKQTQLNPNPTLDPDKPNSTSPNEDSLAKLFGGNNAAANPASSTILTSLSGSSTNPWLNSGASTMNSGTMSASPTSSSSPLSQALNRYSPAIPNPNSPVPVNPSEPNSGALGTAGLSQYTPIQGNAPTSTPSYNNLPPLAGSTNVNPSGTVSGSVSGAGMNSFTGLTSGSVPDTVAVPGLNPGVGSAVQTGIPVNSGSTPLPPGTDVGIPITPARSSGLEPAAELPFTTPRSIPGRSIGGGEINTFSNP